MFYGEMSVTYFATRDSTRANMPGHHRLVRKTNTENSATAWRCKPASNISSVKKATSNICTAQALLATMAGFYAVYHGPGRHHCRTHPQHCRIPGRKYQQTGVQAGQCTMFDTLRFAARRHYPLSRYGPSL